MIRSNFCFFSIKNIRDTLTFEGKYQIFLEKVTMEKTRKAGK